jgi:molecular chaperone HscB
MNHFELFGLQPSVDVDVKALEQRYRELALTTHPDRQPDAAARVQAASLSATLNEGLRLLKDPARRATYLLKLLGVDLDAEHAASQVQLPMEFLEEVLERREALERATSQGDLPAARALADAIAAARAEALAGAQAALRAQDVPLATLALARLRYYGRFLEEFDVFQENQPS